LLTTKAKPKIFADNMLRGVGISVDSFGGDVTVRGTVENLKQIEHATAIAESVYGMRKANDLFMIKSLLGHRLINQTQDLQDILH
jgi:osmotically-inducible protein OsmY